MPNEEYGGDSLRMLGMKRLTEFTDRNASKAIYAGCLLVCLAGCATQVAPPPHQADTTQTDEQALAQLRAGKVALDCGQSCASKWLGNMAELQTRYTAGEWRELALLVMQVNYSQDLAYFYLGRAAEGLGDRSAALAYYSTARALATGADNSARCAASQSGCNGLSLLTETLTRRQIVEEEGSRSVAARHQLRARQEPGQPADATGQPPPDNWVDPAPVSR